MSIVLEVESVSKRFEIQSYRSFTLKESIIRRIKGIHEPAKSIWALRDISFSLENGRSIGVIGHNGAGKSTLLRLICGLGRPTAGSIKRIGHVSGLLELGTGFHPDMTGRENILTGGLLNGLTLEKVRAIEDEIISFSELEEFIDQPVRTYSSGMYLRLAFSTAMQFDPDIIVIDEVLAVGDTNFKKKCYQKLSQFRSEGKTMILVSHSMEEIEKLCDHVILLEEGRFIVQDVPSVCINYYHDLMRKRTEKRTKDLYGDQSGQSLQIFKQGSRLGTKEAEITSVTFYNGRDENINTFYSGDSMTIKIDYKLLKPMRDMALTLAIFNELNVKCFENQIASVNDDLGPLKEIGSFYCKIPQLHLLPSAYYINVGLYPVNWDYIFDFHYQMHVINILNGKGKDSGVSGVVSLNPEWDTKSPE